MELQLDNAAIGQRIKRRRMHRGLNQSELAQVIGISQTHMSNLEHGKVGMTLDVLVRLAHTLACSLDDIVLEPREQPAADDARADDPSLKLRDYRLSDLLKAAELLKTLK